MRYLGRKLKHDKVQRSTEGLCVLEIYCIHANIYNSRKWLQGCMHVQMFKSKFQAVIDIGFVCSCGNYKNDLNLN